MDGLEAVDFPLFASLVLRSPQTVICIYILEKRRVPRRPKRAPRLPARLFPRVAICA